MREFDSFLDAFGAFLNEFQADPRDPAAVAFVLGAINGGIDGRALKVKGIEQQGRLFQAQTPDVLRELIRKYPGAFLEQIKGSFVAGGLLPTIFGKEGDNLWKMIVQQIEVQGSFEFAKISLTREDMELAGGFFRWLNMDLFCVDERLDMLRGGHGIHCKCGACAAVSKSLGLTDNAVEDDLHRRYNRRFRKQQKRPILQMMERAHASLAVMVSYDDDPVMIRADLREILARHGMLPFHASIPLKKAQRYIRKEHGNDEAKLRRLIEILCLLNIQIPLNIINDHHNDLHAYANQADVLLPDARRHPQDLVGIVQGFAREGVRNIVWRQ